MPVLIDTRTGPIVQADGAGDQPLRQGRSGALVVSDAHGRYYEAALRGNLFVAANTAVQALSLGSATATGLILTNPFGSNKNLILLEVACYIAAAITAVANVALFANINPVAATVVHTTPIVPRNALLGAGTGVGLVDSAATLPAAPTLIRSLFGWHWVTAGTPATQLGVKEVIDGGIILAPGTAVSVQGVTVAHTTISSFVWEEVAA